MYLKSLTLRGFKSFASATTLRLEPGITCVVGPNGSGKSNVVDALSWVMGEQGAKSLRGGKMEDVIFAGTTNRAPLGRAEVTLTIDNSDGALPIDYAEVTISRLMFRSGQSEYAINGDSCRLLDVQDLLSDSGLGREMHVIVGQGQLDQILHAGPEARRAIIEEAAGVLKHRKRKEKALRKLDAMQVNLTRLVDLTSELGRRLKPLGRQAEVARKAATIQAELRDAKLRLLADDYVHLRDKLEREEADEAAIRARRAELEAALADARARESAFDVAVQAQAAELARAQQTWFALSSLTEKLRSVQGLAAERVRLLAADAEPERPGRDPDELDRQAAELRAEEAGPDRAARRGPRGPGGVCRDAHHGRDRARHRRAQARRRRAGRRGPRRAPRPAARHGRRRGQPGRRDQRGNRPPDHRRRGRPGPRRARAPGVQPGPGRRRRRRLRPQRHRGRAGRRPSENTSSTPNEWWLRASQNAPPTARWRPCAPARKRSARPFARASTRRPRSSPTRSASAACSAPSPPGSPSPTATRRRSPPPSAPPPRR